MVWVVGKKGAYEAGGRGLELLHRHGWLQKGNEVISSAWKCILVWQISTLSWAFEQERAGEKKGGGRGGFKRFRSHIISRYPPVCCDFYVCMMRDARVSCVGLFSAVLYYFDNATYTTGGVI